MSVTTVPFEADKFFADEASQVELIADAFETGDPAYIANAIGIVARARGMSAVAKDSGLTREALYSSLSDKGDPKLSTLLRVMKALGLELTARARQPA